MSNYPEHGKLHAVVDKSQACGELLDWLQSKGIFLAQKHEHNPLCYEHGEVQPPAGPRRSRKYPPFRHGRYYTDEEWLTCDFQEGQLVNSMRSFQSLLAEFFEIDQNRLEEEKCAMLDAIRARSAV